MSTQTDREGVTEGAAANAAAGAGAFESLSAQTLSRQVARALVASLLQERFRPGEPLPSSSDLAREFRVSRPVVREALNVVATLGMIDTRQGRPTRVTDRSCWNDLSPELLAARLEIGALEDILMDSLELRRIIETEAAALAAERATDADVAEIRRHLDALDRTLQDTQAYMTHDVDFHDAVLRAAHNRLFQRLIDQMRELLVLARTVSMTPTSERVPESRQGHRGIMEAIEARSPEAARSAMADHLRWAERVNASEYRAARRAGSSQRAEPQPSPNLPDSPATSRAAPAP